MQFCSGCVEGVLANAVILRQELHVHVCGDVWESFSDCAGKSVLNCLQTFHLTRVDAVEKGIAVID